MLCTRSDRHLSSLVSVFVMNLRTRTCLGSLFRGFILCLRFPTQLTFSVRASVWDLRFPTQLFFTVRASVCDLRVRNQLSFTVRASVWALRVRTQLASSFRALVYFANCCICKLKSILPKEKSASIQNSNVRSLSWCGFSLSMDLHKGIGPLGIHPHLVKSLPHFNFGAAR